LSNALINTVKESLWNQFGASVDMLENAIRLCPLEYWNTDKKFWYNAYHALFFLDYYLSTDPHNFTPPQPFTESEFEDRMPDRVYSKDELINYLFFCRSKSQDLISNLTEESATRNWINMSQTMVYPTIEILIYNMRHVQHHTAQLNLLLRQEMNNAPEWVFRTGEMSH
jgi:hypothetical protein